MPKTIEAVYENGVIMPLQKIELKGVELVEIKIKEKRIGKRFYRRLEEFKKKAPKVRNAIKVLEEVRNDSYLYLYAS